MAIQFNVEPYWDDFESVASGNTLSPKEQYQKILFYLYMQGVFRLAIGRIMQ